jgi:N-acetylmuramoyl-L-alanine amidase
LSQRRFKAELKRYAAPVAFLAAVTIAVLLVRDALNTNSSSPASPTVTTTATTQTTTTTSRNRRPKAQYYRLRGGETLSDVALRFDTTVEELLRLNPKVEPTQLTIGQRIRVR